jgi:hypothetical protein
LVWFVLVWFGLVWFGLVWFGLVWFTYTLNRRFGVSHCWPEYFRQETCPAVICYIASLTPQKPNYTTSTK